MTPPTVARPDAAASALEILRAVLVRLVALILLGLVLSAGIAAALVGVEDQSAKDRCFSAAGRVEHYDGDRPDVWRCVGARAEGE